MISQSGEGSMQAMIKLGFTGISSTTILLSIPMPMIQIIVLSLFLQQWDCRNKKRCYTKDMKRYIPVVIFLLLASFLLVRPVVAQETTPVIQISPVETWTPAATIDYSMPYSG